MPDTEELKLVVTLDDQATAGLQKLRSELQQIGSIGAISSFERLKRAMTAAAEKASAAQIALARGWRKNWCGRWA
jgi:hypothetical protein